MNLGEKTSLEYFLGESVVNVVYDIQVARNYERTTWDGTLLSKVLARYGDKYISKSQKELLIAYVYEIYRIFIWDDTVNVLEPDYVPPTPFHKWPTGCTAQPYIVFKTAEDYSYLTRFIKNETNVNIIKLLVEIKNHLKSRNFNAAKKLLPRLGKLNKQNYSYMSNEYFPNCILLRLFNIE